MRANLDYVRTGRRRPAGLGPGEQGEERCQGMERKVGTRPARCVCRDTDKDKFCDVLNSIPAGKRVGGEEGRSVNRLLPKPAADCLCFQTCVETWDPAHCLGRRINHQTPGHLASAATSQTVARKQLRNGKHFFLPACTPIPEPAPLHLLPPL